MLAETDIVSGGSGKGRLKIISNGAIRICSRLQKHSFPFFVFFLLLLCHSAGTDKSYAADNPSLYLCSYAYLMALKDRM